MLVACKKINVFGRDLRPGDMVTELEEARWRRDPHADSLRACLQQAHVRELTAEEAAQYALEQPGTPADSSHAEEAGTEFDCCGKIFKNQRALSNHKKRAAAHR